MARMTCRQPLMWLLRVLSSERPRRRGTVFGAVFRDHARNSGRIWHSLSGIDFSTMIRSSPTCFGVAAAQVKCGLRRNSDVFADLMFRLDFAGARAEERTKSLRGTARITKCRTGHRGSSRRPCDHGALGRPPHPASVLPDLTSRQRTGGPGAFTPGRPTRKCGHDDARAMRTTRREPR